MISGDDFFFFSFFGKHYGLGTNKSVYLLEFHTEFLLLPRKCLYFYIADSEIINKKEKRFDTKGSQSQEF